MPIIINAFLIALYINISYIFVSTTINLLLICFIIGIMLNRISNPGITTRITSRYRIRQQQLPCGFSLQIYDITPLYES